MKIITLGARAPCPAHMQRGGRIVGRARYSSSVEWRAHFRSLCVASLPQHKYGACRITVDLIAISQRERKLPTRIRIWALRDRNDASSLKPKARYRPL